MLPLLSSTEVLSRKHQISWWVFSLAAGAVNSGAFVATEKFVSHITGTLTGAGLEEFAEDAMLLIGSFIAGAMVSALMLQVPLAKGKRVNPQAPLWLVAAIIGGAGVLGRVGVFGEMGGDVNDWPDLILLSMLGFSMGLLNATVASTTTHAVRTTHVTGPATDFGVYLAHASAVQGEERTKLLRLATQRGGHLLFFGLGAAAMPFAVIRLGFLAFLIPAALVVVGALRSFRAEAQPASAPVTA